MAYEQTEEPEVQETPDLMSARAAVKGWIKRIKDAKKCWDKDFCRLKDNMEFAAGFQWAEQEAVDDDKYIANQVNPLVNQKVSLLYARDPKAEAHRRKRLDFQIWDGRMESLQMAMTNPMDPASMALMMDFTAGRQRRDLLDRIGKTLEIVYKWQLDNQAPSFKLQMKQLVRRVVTCGIGFVKLGFTRQFAPQLTADGPDNSMAERLKTIQYNAECLAEGESDSSPVLEETRMLANSVAASQAAGDLADVDERLVIDFPPATSIIVDRNCRALKGFIGARWVAQQYLVPIDAVNEFFETQVKVGGDLVLYSEDGTANEPARPPQDATDQVKEQLVCVFEVFDYNTKSHFFICDGWKDYLKEPEAVAPQTKRFWPFFALSFNDIETEPGQRTTIYPPSDVQLMKSAQKEWNRTREALRAHRKANAPMYVVAAGALDEPDKKRLECHPDNAVIEITGAQGTDVSKLVLPFAHAPIDPALYETLSLQQDLRVTLGNQEGALPASSKSTATAATINEQQRITTTSSNVDDLDDLLSDLAEASSEILLRELSPQTAQRIAGPGAVWPQVQREDFVNEIFLGVQAASSGRPNKAIEISNFQQLAPILLQAGASPHFIIREGIRRLDDRLDPDDAFPLGPGVGPAVPATQPPPSGEPTPTAQNQNPAGHIKDPNVERPDNVPQPQVQA